MQNTQFWARLNSPTGPRGDCTCTGPASAELPAPAGRNLLRAFCFCFLTFCLGEIPPSLQQPALFAFALNTCHTLHVNKTETRLSKARSDFPFRKHFFEEFREAISGTAQLLERRRERERRKRRQQQRTFEHVSSRRTSSSCRVRRNRCWDTMAALTQARTVRTARDHRHQLVWQGRRSTHNSVHGTWAKAWLRDFMSKILVYRE